MTPTQERILLMLDERGPQTIAELKAAIPDHAELNHLLERLETLPNIDAASGKFEITDSGREYAKRLRSFHGR